MTGRRFATLCLVSVIGVGALLMLGVLIRVLGG